MTFSEWLLAYLKGRDVTLCSRNFAVERPLAGSRLSMNRRSVALRAQLGLPDALRLHVVPADVEFVGAELLRRDPRGELRGSRTLVYWMRGEYRCAPTAMYDPARPAPR